MKNYRKKKSQLYGWERRYGKAVSEEGYKQICDNISVFITLLYKWNKTKNK
jgi:hypothetical protein